MGKTTILESIYYMCTTKSSIARTDSEALNFNEDFFEISGLFRGITENTVRIYFSQNDNKKLYFKDGKQISRSADVIGKFPVVILAPADHNITQGAPSDRRKFIDSVISQASETYLFNLIEYNRILRQRSSLLNHIKETRNEKLLQELDAWTENLINKGSELIEQRQVFIKEFSGFIRESYKTLLDEHEVPGVEYYYLEGSSNTNVKEIFQALIKDRKEEELRRAANLVGPHRDDFLFTINNMNLRTFGSQGQHKTFQVVLRFAEFFYLKERTGNTPIFLLDDVFGELDTNRSERISEYLRNVGQAFITITDFANLSYLKKNAGDFHISLKEGIVNYA